MALVFIFYFFKSLIGSGVIGPWFALGHSLFVKLLGRAFFVFLLVNILLSFQSKKKYIYIYIIIKENHTIIPEP